jgi:hypothetical protein
MCDMCENCCEAFVGTYEGYYVSKDDKKMRVCRCCKNEYVMMGWIGIKVEELDMKLANECDCDDDDDEYDDDEDEDPKTKPCSCGCGYLGGSCEKGVAIDNGEYDDDE